MKDALVGTNRSVEILEVVKLAIVLDEEINEGSNLMMGRTCSRKRHKVRKD